MSDKKNYDELIEGFLSSSYKIIDIFPQRVSEEYGREYDIAVSYFEEKEKLSLIYKEYGELFLILSCYYDLLYSIDEGPFLKISDGHQFVESIAQLSDTSFLRLLINEEIMIDLDAGDTYLTVYGNEGSILELIKKLFANKGFYIW